VEWTPTVEDTLRMARGYNFSEHDEPAYAGRSGQRLAIPSACSRSI
jgi:hypothetical protein